MVNSYLLVMMSEEKVKIIVKNRKARHDYQIFETYEAGISLLGSEVKSLREGKINISDAYAFIKNGEVWLKNLHISPYKMASEEYYDPLRLRRLLLHKREIRKMFAKTEQKGQTLIPVTIYFKNNIVKIELALAVGRKKYDKREAIAKSDAQRRIKSALKNSH